MMESIWQKGVTRPKFDTLKGDLKTDVLIIGGGISGILTAYFLHKYGVRYALVEKDRICRGTTENTTAKITSQHGLCYHKILKSSGEETCKAYLKANNLAAKKYKELSGKIDADYETIDNFVYTAHNQQKLYDEMTALDKIGFKAEYVTDLPLPIKTAGAVCFKNQANFNPLKFLYSIAKGLNIYENTFVKEVKGNTALTEKGKITAKKIIVTTHFPFIDRHGSYFLKLYQHRSYVIALKNAQNLSGMYVDDDKKGLSFRNYKDILLLGGGGHRTGKKGGSFNELRRFANKHYPNSKEICYWAAQDCMSLDNMLYVGNYSKNTPNLYTASGFNKWGMTGAMLSAMILSDLVLDKPNEFSEFFSPSRSILKPQLFLNGVETTLNLLTPTPKRCSHLGCALKWNKAEHSWDCACHGSRFDKNGKVLENPATRDIGI